MADTEIIKGLTVGQTRQIRQWRDDIGRATWNLNESEGVFDLKRMHEVGRAWSPDVVIWFSKEIERLVVRIVTIRRAMVSFLKSKDFDATYYVTRWKRTEPGRVGTKQRRKAGSIYGGKRLAAKYRSRLESAVDGLQMAVGFLNDLTPKNLDVFVDENLALLDNDFENIDDLFLSVCPTKGRRVAQTGAQKRRQLRKENSIRDQIAQGDLDGALAVSETMQAKGDYVEAGCYNLGMAALRLAWKALYVTLEKRDVRQVLLEDEDYWYRTIEDNRKAGLEPRPPDEIMRQYDALAAAEKAVLQVYDSEGNLAYEAYPANLSAAGEYLKLKMLPKSKARAKWNWRDVTPSTGREFAQSLTPAQSKKVEKFLKAHPDREISIWELAWVADVDVMVAGPAGVTWVPERIDVTALKREALSEIGYKPNEGSIIDYSRVFKDYGAAKAMWSMDIPL